MESQMTDYYALSLAHMCLPLPTQHTKPINSDAILHRDINPIIERWVYAPGWDRHTPDEQRLEALLRFVKRLSQTIGGRVPLEWLIFPFNAARALRARAPSQPDAARRQCDEWCAASLQCYALAQQIAECQPTCRMLGEQTPGSLPVDCAMVKTIRTESAIMPAAAPAQ